MAGAEDLEGAYGLRTPEDSVRFYREWAAHYDSGFAAGKGYVYPAEIARLFLAEGGSGPVLDIGAGTGLVAEALGPAGPAGIDGIDGIDISAEMLAVARGKGLYRRTIVADLTKPLPLPDAAYAGLVSAGTFTHGHVGPDCLAELLRVARPGALAVLGIHAGVLDGAGFGSALARLVAAGRISPIAFRLLRIYAEGADHPHAGDEALAAVFRRL